MSQLAEKAYLTHSGLQHCILFYLLFILYLNWHTKGLPNALRLAAGNCVRIGNKSGCAAADGVSASGDGALRTGAARRGIARIRLRHTPLTLAHIAVLAVRITDAFRLAPGDGVRIRDESGLTSADGVTAPSHRAFRAGTARRRIAGVRLRHTPLAQADVTAAMEALGITHTLWPAASDGVRLRHEPGLALTDGVTSPVYGTPGPRTAGVRRTRIRLLLTLVTSADKAHPTIRIHAALRLAPGNRVRIRGVAGDAAALGIAVTVQRTGRPGAARRGTAGVSPWTRRHAHRQVVRATRPAQPVLQDDRRAGVLVRRTAAVHRARHGDVAGHACADRVALIVDGALGVLATGRRGAGRPRVLELAVVAGRPHGAAVRLPGHRDEVLGRCGGQ
jgi:hypothetical protein